MRHSIAQAQKGFAPQRPQRGAGDFGEGGPSSEIAELGPIFICGRLNPAAVAEAEIPGLWHCGRLFLEPGDSPGELILAYEGHGISPDFARRIFRALARHGWRVRWFGADEFGAGWECCVSPAPA